MKKLVLFTTLEPSCLNNIKHVKNDIDITQSQVHIVTVIQIQVYNFELSPYIYPTEAQYTEMEDSAMKIMRALGDSLSIDPQKIIYKCFFEFDAKNKASSYLKEIEADLAVVSTRGKHGIPGLFVSSFAEYLCKFSPCDVLVIRPCPIAKNS